MSSFSFRARPGAKIQVFQTSSGTRLCIEDSGVATIDSNHGKVNRLFKYLLLANISGIDLDIQLNFTTNELSLLVIPADFSERILEAINPMFNVFNCYNFRSECHESPPNYTNTLTQGRSSMHFSRIAIYCFNFADGSDITSSYQDTVLETSVSRPLGSPTIGSVEYSPQRLATGNSHEYAFFKFPEMGKVCHFLLYSSILNPPSKIPSFVTISSPLRVV